MTNEKHITDVSVRLPAEGKMIFKSSEASY
jgi:hypothetical protein